MPTTMPIQLALVASASGDLWVAGWFKGDLDLGGSTLKSAGAEDIFVASFTCDGALRWAKRFGGTGSDRGQALALGNAGDLYLAGSFSDQVDFEGTVLKSAGGTDFFLHKLSR